MNINETGLLWFYAARPECPWPLGDTGELRADLRKMAERLGLLGIDFYKYFIFLKAMG